MRRSIVLEGISTQCIRKAGRPRCTRKQHPLARVGSQDPPGGHGDEPPGEAAVGQPFSVRVCESPSEDRCRPPRTRRYFMQKFMQTFATNYVRRREHRRRRCARLVDVNTIDDTRS